MSTENSAVCAICDGDCSPEHKSLSDKQIEWAYANSKKENPETVHFRGYNNFSYICEDETEIETINPFGYKLYFDLVTCEKCKNIAKNILTQH